MARQLLNDDMFPVREQDLELTIEIDPEVTYHLRPLTVDKLRELTKANTRLVPNKRTHQKDEVINNDDASNAILDYVIAKWEGVKQGGVEAACDLAHKLLLPIELQTALISTAQAGDTAAERKARSLRRPE